MALIRRSLSTPSQFSSKVLGWFLPLGLVFFPLIWTLGLINSAEQSREFELSLLASSAQWITGQATLSALGITGFSGLFAIGLLGLSSRVRSVFEWIGLMPLAMPSIAMVVSLKSWQLPSGLWLIVLAHIALYSGYFGVQLSRRLRETIGNEGEAALTLGSDRFLLWSFFLRHQLVSEGVRTFGFSFALCATGLSLPLMLGSSGVYSTETAILEAVRKGPFWTEVFVLGLIHIGLLLFTASGSQLHIPGTVNRAGLGPAPLRESQIWDEFGVWPFSFLALIFAGLIIAPFLLQALRPPFQILDLVAFSHLFEASLTTLSIFALTALFSLTALLALCVLSVPPALNWMLGAAAVPSTVLWGLALTESLSGLGVSIGADVLRMSVALSVVAVPFFWRSRWSLHRRTVQRLMSEGELLGAGGWLTLWRLILPSSSSILFWSLKYLIVFVVGDFAISSLVSLGGKTLGLLGYQLVNSYHLQAAQQLVFYILVLSAGLWWFLNWFEQSLVQKRRA